jgi:hypothetical protein
MTCIGYSVSHFYWYDEHNVTDGKFFVNYHVKNLVTRAKL